MRPGRRVLLVGTEPGMPPIGAEGVIVSEVDDEGDHEVRFDRYACPVPPGITWWVPAR